MFLTRSGLLWSVTALMLFWGHAAQSRVDPPIPAIGIRIDGLDFGTFIPEEAFLDLLAAPQESTGPIRLRVTRSFVTRPSLAHWAWKSTQMQSGFANIEVTLPAKMPHPHLYLLTFCKPLAWSVEVAGTAIGGFYEQVELSAQSITAL